jgi:hypothetical protein
MGNAMLIVMALQSTHGLCGDDQQQRNVATRESASATIHDAAKAIGRDIVSLRRYSSCRSGAITNIARLHFTSR